MSWTETPPTSPGFYYWQGGALRGHEVAVVQVTAFRDASLPLEAAELLVDDQIGHRNAPAKGPAESWGGRWAGPLPQPRHLPGGNHALPKKMPEASGAALAGLRRSRGLTQRDVALLVHAGLRTVNRWECGDQPIPAAEWELLWLKLHA